MAAMEANRQVWVLDPRILDYLKFDEFHWWEILLIIGSLSALASYFLLVIYLDRRARAREKRLKQLARLQRWLAEWDLTPTEVESLQALSGDRKRISLYRLLSEPARFEAAVHRAAEAGQPLSFAERVRDALDYHSGNLRVPVVSTRQLVPGDHFRFAVWEGGRPQHHYGQVITVGPAGLTLELTDDGFRAVRGKGAEMDAFYLRGNDSEYRFPLRIRGAVAGRNLLTLAHQLVGGGQRPRGARLPIVKPMSFRVRTELAGPEAPEANLDLVPAQEMRGVLLEMSEGGFSLVLNSEIPGGSYVSFELPRPRRRTLAMMGRVLDCRPFGGNRWLVRCELRGLTATQRSVLGQLLRMERQRRLRLIRSEQRELRRSM